MFQPIRGQGGHNGFQIGLRSNNTWLGPHKEHVWQVWGRSLQLFLRRSSKCEKLTDGRTLCHGISSLELNVYSGELKTFWAVVHEKKIF